MATKVCGLQSLSGCGEISCYSEISFRFLFWIYPVRIPDGFANILIFHCVPWFLHSKSGAVLPNRLSAFRYPTWIWFPHLMKQGDWGGLRSWLYFRRCLHQTSKQKPAKNGSFMGFPQLFQAITRTESIIRLQPLPSRSFPIVYSLSSSHSTLHSFSPWQGC